MKILFVTYYYPPDLCAGSFRAGALVSALSKALPDTLNLDVLTTLPNRYGKFRPDVVTREQSDHITIHRFPVPAHQSGMLDQARSFTVFARQCLRFVKGKHYDLVLATSSRLMTAALAAKIAKKTNAPLYLDIRDLFVETITEVLPGPVAVLLKPALQSLEKHTFLQARHINIVSPGFEGYFQKRYPQIPLSFHTNGIDREFLEQRFDKGSEPPSKPLRILYVGNIGAGQGLEHIVPALANALEGQAEFRIIGAGGTRDALIRNLGKSGCCNAELLLPVERSLLLEEYRQADVLFLHLNNLNALQKVLPSKLFEYAATGKPILAGVGGYAASFIHEHIPNAAVFSPCDVKAAVQAFKRLDKSIVDRSSFVRKYSRTTIMEKMAQGIISCARKNQ
jgi:glycosyltransferase involved in cell wall biosynthesis